MPLLGFSIGTSDSGPDFGKSLDDIIADRRKEQAKAASGKSTKDSVAQNTRAKEKKSAMADRSIATGRAKRAAANRARRGLAAENKPSAMEVEKEVYRQARKTAVSKKAAEKKATNGRLAPNSSLREKKKIKRPSKKQLQAATKGMELAGCPVPAGFELFMEFSQEIAKEKKGKQTNANNKKNNNNTKSNANQKTGGRRKSGKGGKN